MINTEFAANNSMEAARLESERLAKWCAREMRGIPHRDLRRHGVGPRERSWVMPLLFALGVAVLVLISMKMGY